MPPCKENGQKRIIAETGAGQHGVATATVAALLGLECVVYMGKLDTERQALNVYRMKLLGADVVPVETGTKSLKDAVNEALREWSARCEDTAYCIGSVMGPHPYPMMVRDFQKCHWRGSAPADAGKRGAPARRGHGLRRRRQQCHGAFLMILSPDPSVQLIGVEAAGRGIDTAETAATISCGRPGIFHGMESYFLQDDDGQIAPVYSISAGLDYPGIGPEHAHLYDTGRAQYVAITDDEAVAAFEYLSRMEGVIPAIESAHAVAYAMKLAPTLPKDKSHRHLLIGPRR